MQLALLANGMCFSADRGKGSPVLIAPRSTLSLPSAVLGVQQALSRGDSSCRPLLCGSPSGGLGWNCVIGINESDSPLNSCWLWERSLFSGDFVFPRANVGLDEEPVASPFQI